MRRAVILVGLISAACGGADFSAAALFTGTNSAGAGAGDGGGGTQEEPVAGKRTHNDAGATQEAGGGAGGEPVEASAGAGGEPTEDGGPPAGGGTGGSTGGAVSNGGSGGQAGVGGRAAPDIDECAKPTDQWVMPCDGLCGNTSYTCDTCRTNMGGGYVNLGATDNPTNNERNCPGCTAATLQMVAKGLTCTKLTAQSGAHVRFRVGSCSAPTVENCAIAVGLSEGAAKEAVVYVDRPDQNAWIHKEDAELILGGCPLSCP